MPISWSVYATCASLFILFIFIAIVVQMISGQQKLYRKTGVSSLRIDKAIQSYLKKDKTTEEQEAFTLLKKQTGRLVGIWITLLLTIVILTLLIGALIGFK